MKDVSKHLGPLAAATNAPSLPAAVERATFHVANGALPVGRSIAPPSLH